MYLSLEVAHTSGSHVWPASTTLLKKNSQPWTLDASLGDSKYVLFADLSQINISDLLL